MTRTLSHTEIARVSTCEFQWDAAYGGYSFGGDTLKPRTSVPHLRDGRAWGRAVAAYQEACLLIDADVYAHTAIDDSLLEDAKEQYAAGTYDTTTHREAAEFLHGLLDHYIELSDPLPITRPEHELDVTLPSRTGGGSSSLYRFLAFLDGIHVDADGREWIFESKLRGQLTDLRLLELDRQNRRYAWAAGRALDINPVGVIVDERWKEIPKPPRVLKSGKPSHAKDQLCTANAYAAICAELDEPVSEETFEALSRRRWQQREWIIFRPGELEEAGEELVSAAQLIRDLDSGHRLPIRNPSRAHCGGCAFRDPCRAPEDTDVIDMAFTRTLPKRLRDKDAPVDRGAMDGQVRSDQPADSNPVASPEPSTSDLASAAASPVGALDDPGAVGTDLPLLGEPGSSTTSMREVA